MSKSIGIFILLFFVVQILSPINAQAQSFNFDTALKTTFGIGKFIANTVPAGQVASVVGENIQSCSTDITCHILQAINFLIDGILYYPLVLSQFAVEKAFNVNLSILNTGDDNVFINAGWPIIRDISNIFFVFILLWIALATIFDVETYSAKKLLPTFIISALLINFSLPIGTFVIKTANSIATVYYPSEGIGHAVRRLAAPTEQILKTKQNPSPDQPTGTGKKLADLPTYAKDLKIKYIPKGLSALAPESITINQKECEDARQAKLQGKGFWGTIGRSGSIAIQDFAYAEGCAQATGFLYQTDAFLNVNISDNSYQRLLAKQVILKLFISPIAIFVLLAVAILLIVRYVSLLFLLVLGPFAFLSMILPSTEKYWHDWWEKLIKWSLFMPAFSILFSISINMLDQLNKNISVLQVGSGTAIISGDASFFNYLLTIAFMIGSLLAAQQLGIYGAGTAINLGKRASGAVGNWAKRGALAPVRLAGANISEGARIATGALSSRVLQGSLGEIPGLRTLAAKGAGVGKLAQDARYKRQYGDNIKDLSDEDKARYMEISSPKAAGQMLTKMKEGEREKVIDKMSGERQRQFIEKVGSSKQGLVTNATNNPEVIVDTLFPGLKTRDPKKHREEVTKQLAKMNPRTLSPEYIQNMDVEIVQNMTSDMAQKIASTPDGVKALNQRLNTLSPGEQLGINADLSRFFGTALGGALLRGTTLPTELSKEEKISKDINELITKKFKEQEDQKPTKEEKSPESPTK